MLLRLVRRSLVLRRQRFWIAVTSVALGTAVAVAFADLSLVLGDRLSSSLRAYGANLILVPEGSTLGAEVGGSDYQPPLRTAAIAESTLARIDQSFWRHNIIGYAPQLAAPGAVKLDLTSGSPGPGLPQFASSATVVGTWFEVLEPSVDGPALVAGMLSVAPWWKVEGELPGGEPVDVVECLVGASIAQRLGLTPGMRAFLDLSSNLSSNSGEKLAGRGVGMVPVRVSGVLHAGGLEDETIYIPLAALQRALSREGEIDRVLISALITPGFPPRPDPSADPEDFERWYCTPYVTSLAYDLNRTMPGVEARPVSQLVEAEGEIVHRLNLLMFLLALAGITGAALGVMSTMTATVVERTPEFALQRSLGAPKRALLILLSVEGFVISVMGGVIGSALGLTLSQVAGRAAFDFAMPFHPLVLVLGLVVALAVTTIGAWTPFHWATSLSPARGLRS